MTVTLVAEFRATCSHAVGALSTVPPVYAGSAAFSVHQFVPQPVCDGPFIRSELTDTLPPHRAGGARSRNISPVCPSDQIRPGCAPGAQRPQHDYRNAFVYHFLLPRFRYVSVLGDTAARFIPKTSRAVVSWTYGAMAFSEPSLDAENLKIFGVVRSQLRAESGAGRMNSRSND